MHTFQHPNLKPNDYNLNLKSPSPESTTLGAHCLQRLRANRTKRMIRNWLESICKKKIKLSKLTPLPNLCSLFCVCVYAVSCCGVCISSVGPSRTTCCNLKGTCDHRRFPVLSSELVAGVAPRANRPRNSWPNCRNP